MNVIRLTFILLLKIKLRDLGPRFKKIVRQIAIVAPFNSIG